jgi:two-component system cell cycle response regulator
MEILIAEDDRVTVQILSSVLKKAGYDVLIAHDAMQAVMMAMRKPPDAILLDIGMPGGTGMQVLQRLKASTRTSMIPVIVLTGSTEPDLPDRVRALGAAEFMSKPVDPATLLSTLQRLLGQPES